MTTLFKVVLAGMEDNNDINDTKFSDWSDAQHAIDTYSENFDGECSEKEMKSTIKALDLIISSDEENSYEEKCQKAITAWNIEIWGQDFGNNSGSVPFGG